MYGTARRDDQTVEHPADMVVVGWVTPNLVTPPQRQYLGAR